MYKILQIIIIGSTCQVLEMIMDEVGRWTVCNIIHESDFKSVVCLYLMAASATHELLLEFSSSKEKDDRLVESWSGK